MIHFRIKCFIHLIKPCSPLYLMRASNYTHGIFSSRELVIFFIVENSFDNRKGSSFWSTSWTLILLHLNAAQTKRSKVHIKYFRSSTFTSAQASLKKVKYTCKAPSNVLAGKGVPTIEKLDLHMGSNNTIHISLRYSLLFWWLVSGKENHKWRKIFPNWRFI